MLKTKNMKSLGGRIGNKPINIPAGITVEKTGNNISVSGPKGILKMEIDPTITWGVEKDEKTSLGKIIVKRKRDEKKVRAMHGLVRNLIANMIVGVVDGWSKNLELVGVGFRVQGGGNQITLNVGFSHPVEIDAPEGITFEILDNTKIRVSGIDKQLVGQTAANIRKVRIPDVYKGKGIRYEGEYVRKKLGKTGKIGAAVGGAGGGKI